MGRMNPSQLFHRASVDLLRELLHGAPADAAYILNPGDAGLLRQLEQTSAAVASSRPMPGRTTIASHIDHVLYGITLLNRWSDGEENPWATADWDASWRRTQVDEAQWRDLVLRLRSASDKWLHDFERRTDWNQITAAGAAASVAHTAYHIGAVRQLLAAAGHAPAA